MDIIFVTLPKYLGLLSILLQKFGHQVYYLKLSGYKNIEKENISVERLKHAGVLPLPFEDLTSFTGFAEPDGDPYMKAYTRTQEIAPVEFLHFFEKLFPNNPHIAKKLQIAVHSIVASQIMNVTGKVNVWAGAYPDRNHLLIDVSPLSLTAPELAPNVRLLVIPLYILAIGVEKVISIFHEFLHILKTSIRLKGKSACPPETHSREVDQSRVAYVTHKGLDYGNLFQKDLFYSTRTDSELHPERLLHIDYSGLGSPSEKFKWVCLGNHRQSWISNISSAMVAMSKGLLHIRRLRHIMALFILTRFYVIFRSFSTKLEAYPELKIALIDYEILCPKELLLAFESKGIKTVATQERFIFAFNNLYVSIILNYYLCASPFAAEAMRRSPLNCVDHYLPVGQYRSDNLLEPTNSHPPQILEAPLAKGLRIITALGFHTHIEWQNSQIDLGMNWKSHQNFLDDMIRLSRDIPDVFIILRYKTVDWISLPIFSETVQKINSSDNMRISMDYEKSFVSYDLCAHSDLVIAKHTSLADDCLSVGIPVLFHEYTHNTERLMADEFDYTPARIMCFNYQELLERAKIILSGTPNDMTEDYEYLKNVVYGGLGDGRVKERIHAYIEELLSKL